MKNEYLFQFKSREEIYSLFTENIWFKDIYSYNGSVSCWNSKMDCYLNKPVPKKYNIECLKVFIGLKLSFNIVSRYKDIDLWYITADMVKPIRDVKR